MEMKTPLYDAHVRAGGKIVPFGGYLLPVQYGTGIITEHMAVRTKAGLFDVSHMGELILKGAAALENLQHLLTNDFSNMEIGQCRYSPMCNQQGGIVDDLLVYKMAPEEYLLVVNAANRQKDADWIKNNLQGEVFFADQSDATAQMALQGPLALEILLPLVESGSLPEKYYTFTKNVQVAGVNCLVSKTGYTGEDGFELYCDPRDVGRLWDTLLAKGGPLGLIPCGLGARDTLRLEASMPLYGHEMNDGITPAEAGLGFFVKMNKEDFIGKQAMEQLGLPSRKRVGLKLMDRGIAREDCSIYTSGGQLIGRTTSGTHAPYLGYAVAMALLDVQYAALEQEVWIDVRGRKLKAQVVKMPFYSKKK
jgi:aminomethyltransferase